MSYMMVAMAVGGFGSSYLAGKEQQALQEAETKELKAQQRSQYNAIGQAQLDRQRETDLTIYQQEREARRAESMARANQANSGIAGVTANRQLDNVLFQNVLDENFIKAQGLNDLIAIRSEGWQTVSGMQSNINRSINNTPSDTQVWTKAFMSGVSGGMSGYSATSKSTSTPSTPSSSSTSSTSSTKFSDSGSKYWD